MFLDKLVYDILHDNDKSVRNNASSLSAITAPAFQLLSRSVHLNQRQQANIALGPGTTIAAQTFMVYMQAADFQPAIMWEKLLKGVTKGKWYSHNRVEGNVSALWMNDKAGIL